MKRKSEKIEFKTMDERVRKALEENGFEIIEMIGQGGFAHVMTVRWFKYPNQVFVAKAQVIKTLGDMSSFNSYHAEIRALKKLFHRNIVKIFHHFEVDGILVIIMEYCQNGTLQEHVERTGKIRGNEFNKIAKQCLEAISFCHSLMISHRDIKPTNILFDSNFNVKLVDFGISEVLNEKVSRFDGSLAFCPPEIIKRVAHDPMKADIWSLGVTFYYCIVGALPWCIRSPQILKSDIISGLVVIPQKVSLPIRKMIISMLSLNPAERPSAQELLNSPYFNKEHLKMIHSIKMQTSMQILPTNTRRKKSDRLAFSRISSAFTCAVFPKLDQYGGFSD